MSSIVTDFLRFVYGEGYHPPRPAQAQKLFGPHPDLATADPYLACASGYEPLLRETLQANSQWANQPGGPLGMPPLVAVTHSSLIRLPDYTERLRSFARLLLNAGADPNQSHESLSALYGAAGRNHDAPLTEMLLRAGANPNDNESLYHSVETDDLTCARLLLEAGAKVTGCNALYRVLDFDNPEGLRLLLAHGGDPNEHSGHLNSPLLHAIRRGRSAEHARLLLEAGADPRARTSDGDSAYRMASLYGLSEVAHMLRKLGADEPLSLTDQFVAACAYADAAEATRILAQHPGIVDELSPQQLHQLPNLAQDGCGDAVRVMVEHGWPITVRGGDWHASALNHAVFRGDAALARFLLEHGATWNEVHGYHDNVMGTLSFASKAITVKGGDWLGCARALIDNGMPVPPPEYEFSDEVEAFFRSVDPDRPAH